MNVTSLVKKTKMPNGELQILEDNLKAKIFGQDHAIKAIVDRIKVSKAGLADEKKPIGSFFFSGPTGVGKTELAIELANNLNIHFERFDMSEFSSRHDAKNLVGGSAGLVGYDDGGLLTNAIIENPKCVLLLDEIEKAHKNIIHSFLQILDYGVLTSTKGEKAYFNDVIIIMTSNLGATQQAPVGFGSRENINKQKVIDEHLPPEFKGRLDALIEFHPLNKQMVDNIIDKFLENLQQKLSNKRVTLELSSDLKEYLHDIAYGQKQGARGVQKIIDQKITLKLSDEILFGKLLNGGEVFIDIDNNEEFIFTITSRVVHSQIDDCTFYYEDVHEAQEYAKKNIGSIVKRSSNGIGFIVIDQKKLLADNPFI